jgi:hypothetical protein
VLASKPKQLLPKAVATNDDNTSQGHEMTDRNRRSLQANDQESLIEGWARHFSVMPPGAGNAEDPIELDSDPEPALPPPPARAGRATSVVTISSGGDSPPRAPRPAVSTPRSSAVPPTRPFHSGYRGDIDYTPRTSPPRIKSPRPSFNKSPLGLVSHEAPNLSTVLPKEARGRRSPQSNSKNFRSVILNSRLHRKTRRYRSTPNEGTEVDDAMEEDSEDDEFENDHTLPHLDQPAPDSLGNSGNVSTSNSGTSSPFVTRRKEQQTLLQKKVSLPEDASQIDEARERQNFAEKVGETLRKYKKEMRDDHAMFVRYTLLDTATAIEDRTTKFMDRVSPWAAINPIDWEDNTAKHSTIKVVSTVGAVSTIVVENVIDHILGCQAEIQADCLYEDN